MSQSLTTYKSGQVRFCTKQFCFVADGENGQMLAFGANVLLFATAMLTASKAIALLAKATR